MKTHVLCLLLFLVMVFFPSPLLPAYENKTFTESGEIIDGEFWNMVYIYGNDTVVDMIGGFADLTFTYNHSIFNLSGGHTSVAAYEFSTINVSGGSHSSIGGISQSTINVYNGSSANSISVGGEAIANIFGGVVLGLNTSENGAIFVRGGDIANTIAAYENSVVYLFGVDFEIFSTGGFFGHGTLSGYLQDGTYIDVDLYNTDAYSHIQIVPEPAALLLLGAGSIFLRRKV